MLAVSRLPPSHNAEKILDTVNSVLEQWSIPKNKVFRILTDNGSNMVAAFKSLHTDASDNDSDEEDFADHVTLDDDLDFDAAQESGNELSDEYDLEPIPENDAIAFNHDSVFTTAYKRISCFIHTMQLVVKIFESTPSFRSSIQTAYSIVKKVNKSGKATELLIQKAGKKLVCDCPTR